MLRKKKSLVDIKQLQEKVQTMQQKITLRVARNILEVSIAIAIRFSYFRKFGKPLKIVVFCINAITTL